MDKIRQMLKKGFTMVELMVASVIAVLVIGSAMTAFVNGLTVWQQESIRSELNMDLELAMEMIRQDLRLSNAQDGKMSFYPTNSSTYTAISIPMSTSGVGRIMRNTNNEIVWNQTVIYHVQPGTPDKLMKTTFAPRYTNNAALLYDQLKKVAEATNVAAVTAAKMGSEAVTAKTVFENLVDLSFEPPSSVYNGYHATELKAGTYTFGSLVLDGGYHSLVFTVTGKDDLSTGYDVVIDKLQLKRIMSVNPSERDAELCYPVNEHPASPWYSCTASIGSVSTEYRGGNWIGGAVLKYSSTGAGSTISFPIYNDLWSDNNFDTPGPALASNCSSKIDTNFPLTDIVVSMDKGTCWTASSCGQQTNNLQFAANASVTNVIWGGTNYSGITIIRDGCWAKLWFDKGTNCSLLITNCIIRHQASGASQNVTFDNGNTYLMMSCDDTNLQYASDWVQNWTISKASNYLVSFNVLMTGDRDLDMFIGEETSPSINFFRNSGTTSAPAFHGAGSPQADWQGIFAGGAIAPTFGDVDNDGDNDLLIGIIGQGFRLYTNSGTPKTCAFPAAVAVGSLSGSANPTPILKDFYGNDGLLDVVSGWQSSGGFAFFRNTGSLTVPEWSSVGVTITGLYTGVTAAEGGGGHGSPDLVDINGDGLMDLFSGCLNGYIYHWINTGSASLPVFAYVTNKYNNITIAAGKTSPRFVDMDADGDQDMLVGAADGSCTYYQNNGSGTNAVWAVGAVVETVSGRAVPAFCNIDGEFNGAARWQSTNAVTLSYLNGAASNMVIGLASVETGYPKKAIYRSGIWDTLHSAPNYQQLNFTRYENPPQGNVSVRVRASDYYDMSDMTEIDWRDANAGNLGYFQTDSGNSLSTLPKNRFLQYEALLECNKDGSAPQAHTNVASAKLRDVTINWEAETASVDLQVDFGKAPDCGKLSATVDGIGFANSIKVNMTIYKEGRTGTNTVSGIMEVRPLNTGK